MHGNTYKNPYTMNVIIARYLFIPAILKGRCANGWSFSNEWSGKSIPFKNPVRKPIGKGSNDTWRIFLKQNGTVCGQATICWPAGWTHTGEDSPTHCNRQTGDGKIGASCKLEETRSLPESCQQTHNTFHWHFTPHKKFSIYAATHYSWINLWI